MAWRDFLQMNPENIAKARNTTWGSALAQDFNPRNINYQGFQTNPANVAQSSRVGLGSYINQGLKSLTGKFTGGSNVGGATTLMRKMALSPFGKVAGAAMSLPALAAYGTYKTPAMIDYFTKREPGATKSNVFGVDLTQNANERAALPGSTLDEWASEMGPIPDDGVVPPIKNINKPLPYQDRIMNENLMRDRGNIDNRGINFPSIFGTVKGGLEWLGDKFKRPEAKQRAYEEIMKGGTYKGKPGYELYETPSGLKIGSDILGTGQGYAKNFDSMFGSQSLEEMEQKKLDWAAERLRTGKGLSQRLRNILKQRGITGEASTTDIAPVTTTSGGTGGPNVHGGGSEASFTRTSPGGISQATSRAARTDQGGNVMSGWRLAEGGRIGYRERGFVDPEEDELSIFDFMKDQGVDYDQMAEQVEQKFLSDELGAIDVTDEEIALISELLGSGVTDISTISSQTGKDEGTIERVIRVLNAKAQGGSVGYFDGGLASLI